MNSEAGGKSRAKTVGSKFRASLASLIVKLNTAEPHFIRCVKPNMEKVADVFTPTLVIQQLTFSGIMEAVRIRQVGYPTRMLWADFCSRYKVMLPRDVQQRMSSLVDVDERGRAELCLAELPQALGIVGGVGPKDLMLGLTKVFVKAVASTR